MPHEIESRAGARVLGFGINTAQAHELPGAARFSRQRRECRPSSSGSGQGCERRSLACCWAPCWREPRQPMTYDPANCNGADFDDKLAFTVSKVTAQPRVNFVKSPYDDDFTAAACPAATKACRKKSYLVTGDLVLVGRTQGDFTCVSYQSPLAKKQIWGERLAAQRGG